MKAVVKTQTNFVMYLPAVQRTAGKYINFSKSQIEVLID